MTIGSSQTPLLHEVEEELVSIPVRDGIRLTGRMWRPVGDVRVPAVIESHPYRFDQPDPDMRELARHGYAGIVFSSRGTGNSDGHLTGEYTAQELDDYEDALAWIAAQPWCTGSTGITGISWSGFLALQVAARRPPSLRAIISACSTDDRFASDMHYQGGALLDDNATWGAFFQNVLMAPPDPEVVGERWLEMWRERVDRAPLALAEWMQHQERDGYWEHGSIAMDYSAIEVPTLLVGGWRDMFAGALLRMLENLDAPRRAIVGPWPHQWPHSGDPALAIDFVTESVRWWDRWLKGVDDGPDTDPALRAWIYDPRDGDDPRAGFWIGTELPPESRRERFSEEMTASVTDDPLSGADSALLLNRDWRPTTSRDGATRVALPLRHGPLDLLGAPRIRLHRPNHALGTLVARLFAANADGTRWPLSIGVVNLRAPGAAISEAGSRSDDLEFDLSSIGYRLHPGQYLELEISARDWTVWPTASMSGDQRDLRLTLVLPELPGDCASPVTFAHASDNSRAIETTTAEIDIAEETRGGRLGHRLRQAQFGGVTSEVWVDLLDPTRREDHRRSETEWSRSGTIAKLQAEIVIASDAAAFRVTAGAHASVDGDPVAERTWDLRIPRTRA